MPDLATHSLCGYLVASRYRRDVPLVLIGSVLPDILTRGVSIVIARVAGPWWSSAPDSYEFLRPLHSPLPLSCVCLLLSYCFEETLRRSALIDLFIGSGLHLFLDLLQRVEDGVGYQRVTGGGVYRWFFPFSWYDFQIGLFWPEQSLYAIPPLLILTWLVYRRGRTTAAGKSDQE